MDEIAHILFRQPSNRFLRWLVDPGERVPAHVRALLLSELFNSPRAVFVGVANGMTLTLAAYCMEGGVTFPCMLLALGLLGWARIQVAVRTAAGPVGDTITDLALLTAILWCAMQGVIIFVGMQSQAVDLRTLMAGSAMALLGPICARNYPAPRLALLLVLLVEVPFLLGVICDGLSGLLVFLLQAPLFGYGSMMLVRRFKTLSVDRLLAQHESHELARHDTLTGLLNRAGLVQDLAALQQAGMASFTLFYLDLDGFKQVNDADGHGAGDRLLREVAHRLRACTRSRDILARLGGDEFILVAPALPPAMAPELAETIIRRISDYEYWVDLGITARVGISVGFACCPEDATSLDELHRRADSALYEVKRSGKGTFRRHAAWATAAPSAA